MDYSLITSGMTWSFSRVSAYHDCPYRFLLRYIFGVGEEELFFASYGSFLHRLLEGFYKGEYGKAEAFSRYIARFHREVKGTPPSGSIYRNYFLQGMAFLSSLQEPSEEIVGVEQYVRFSVGDLPFQGYIDLITKDETGRIRVTDHKSRDLKTRSKRSLKGGAKTETDKLLDAYLRQLYLYSGSIKSSFHALPSFLTFNCFRTGTVITEPYSEEAAKEAEYWAVSTVAKINAERDWNPNINTFTCKHICGVHRECEYYQLTGGR